ncbi:MAG: tetratricopeptide repeat protein [Granulosicoccaceae bacterium]|jgi:tetratricopeptide (TPR) repeat protein
MTPRISRSRRWQALALGLLAVLNLSGCGSLEPKAAAEPAEAVAHKPTRPDLPAVPLTPERLYKLVAAEMAGQRGALPLAVRYYVESALETRDPRIVERATRIAMYAGDNVSALKTARLWVKLEPEQVKAQYALARLYVDTGDIPSAVRVLDGIVRKADATDQVFSDLVKLFARDAERNNVHAAMQQLAQRYADNPAAQFALSRVAEQAGKLDEALSAAESAIRLRPKWVGAQQHYARLLHLRGRTDEAIAWLRTVLQEQDDKVLHLTYARMLVEARRFEQARKQFEIVLSRSPGDTDILFALGVLSLQANDLDAAEKYLSRLAEAGDHRIEAAYYLGQIAENRKDYPQAIRWYAQVEQGEYAFEARLRVAGLYARQGNLEAALAHLDGTTTRGEEEHIRVFLARGDAMREVGEYAAAVEMYSEALQEYPDNPDLLYARALMAERIDRLDILIADLKAILAKQPQHPHALNALGYTLADRTDRLDEALGYIEQAIKLLPDDPAILDSMGWVQYRLGNHAEAVRYLTRAYDLNNDAEIAAHLGEVLWVMGKQRRARKVWKQGLEESPDDHILKEVMKRFLP